jgi:hypothetical protein
MAYAEYGRDCQLGRVDDALVSLGTKPNKHLSLACTRRCGRQKVGL